MNVPPFDECSLVIGNQVRNNLGKPGGKDFGDDFVGEIQHANWSKFSKGTWGFRLGNKG